MNSNFGLSDDARARLLARMGSRKADAVPEFPILPKPRLGRSDTRADLDMIRRAGEALGIRNPFFRSHQGIAGAHTAIDGAVFDNFVSYNYLGLNGDARVSQAAKDAIDRYGTSVSASRIVSGERPIHRELETALAELYNAEAALAFVSGHATNVTVIGHLVGRGDLIAHDALSHNSIVQGALVSAAQRISFPHNDLDELERLLSNARPGAERALIIVEGHYSMDGDVPDLKRLIEIAARQRAHIMVDEAHSLGVLGERGHGIAERAGVDPSEIDVWMGTLSKSLSACGGYIAGKAELIEYLRCSAPGFVYSVGLSPPLAAAALASLQILQREPERVARLQANAQHFLKEARSLGLDTGLSIGASIVPVMTGSSITAARAADRLFSRGIEVQPILYPAVPEQSARLRFFLSSEHDLPQLSRVASVAADTLEQIRNEPVDLSALASQLAAG